MTYVVQSGDTLQGIASKYGVTVQELMRLNGLTQHYPLKTGMIITITASTVSNSTCPLCADWCPRLTRGT